MPAFINDGHRPPFRPIVAAVVNGHGLVIGHGVSPPEDPLAGVEQALLQAIGKPAGGFGSGTTPRRVIVDEEALLPLVRRLLPGVPVKMGRSAELEEVFRELSAMDPEPEGRGILGLTTYLGGDLTPALVGSFFAACADLYRREPWALFADDQCLFQVTSRALAMNRWCGCVIGQAGESYGVLLFESRLDQQRFTLLAQTEQDFSKWQAASCPISALSASSHWTRSPAILPPRSNTTAGPSLPATPTLCRCTSTPTSWRYPPAKMNLRDWKPRPLP